MEPENIPLEKIYKPPIFGFQPLVFGGVISVIMMILCIFTGGQNDTTQLLTKLGKHQTSNPHYNTDQGLESLDSCCLQLPLGSENNLCLQVPSLASLLHVLELYNCKFNWKGPWSFSQFQCNSHIYIYIIVPKADMAIEKKMENYLCRLFGGRSWGLGVGLGTRPKRLSDPKLNTPHLQPRENTITVLFDGSEIPNNHLPIYRTIVK